MVCCPVCHSKLLCIISVVLTPMLKKVYSSLPLVLTAMVLSSPASSPATARAEDEAGTEEAGTTVEEKTPQEEKVPKEEKINLTRASGDTTVRDLICRLNLEYGFWGGKKIETEKKDVTFNPQIVDVNLNLGLTQYLVLGAGIATTDSATSFSQPPNFSAARNNLRVGVGYEINRGYRAEAEAIMVRHAGVLSGIQARIIGDLLGANYGPVQDVDFQIGANLIQKIPHLSAQAGTRFLQRFYASLATQLAVPDTHFSVKETQVSLTTAVCHDWEKVKGCLGTEWFYHVFEEGKEQGVLTKFKLTLPRFPYDRRL